MFGTIIKAKRNYDNVSVKPLIFKKWDIQYLVKGWDKKGNKGTFHGSYLYPIYRSKKLLRVGLQRLYLEFIKEPYGMYHMCQMCGEEVATQKHMNPNDFDKIEPQWLWMCNGCPQWIFDCMLMAHDYKREKD